MPGITNPMNPYLWMSLGPYAWSSNYGYEIQLNILPEYIPLNEAKLFHGILNPNHVSQWNPMFSIPFQSNVTNPFLTEQGLQAAYDWGKNKMNEIMSGLKFNETSKNLSTIKGQFEALLKDENLTDAQKTEIQKVIDKAKELQKKLSDYRKEMQKSTSDKEALKKEFESIEKEVKTLHDEAANLIEKIKEELEETESSEVGEQDDVENQPQDNEKSTQNPEMKPQSVVTKNGQKIEGEPGPNGTIVKDGKYYSSSDGTELDPQYALGTEMKMKDGYSARVWANGERVAYRDKDGKEINQVQYAEKYPDEYLNIMTQQFTNAVPEIAKDIKAEVIKDASGKILTVKFTYNDKTAVGNAPVDVKEILKQLGLNKSQNA